MQPTGSSPPTGEPDDVITAVAAEARSYAGRWFAGLDGSRVEVAEVRRHDRPRCFLYIVHLDDGRSRVPVVVKVRHSIITRRRADRFPSRPVLAPDRTVPDAEAARLEFGGLRLIEQLVGTGSDDDYGLVRPLALLPDHAALVMTMSTDPTMRDHLLSAPVRRRPGPPALVAWRRAGVLLRRYHQAPSGLPHGERLAERDDLLDLCRRYGTFLGERLGDSSFFAETANVAAESVAALPERLPLGTDHGDFVTRNLFVGAGGRITMFDPMPLWRAPIYEDMARLIMAGLRLLDVQAYSQGLLFSATAAEAYERAFLSGYFPDSPAPLRAVRAFQLLVLLDRWSARVSKVGLSGSRWRRAALMTLSARHLRHEAERLVTLLRDDERSSSRSARD